MPDPLLSTKLYIPRARVALVPRPRLAERLDAGLEGRLTLVSAPAGYGKTTLVSEWIVQSQVPVAWLSLDASDNDLARFLSYLIAALQAATPQIDPGIGAGIQPVLESGADLAIERLLTALVNDIVAAGAHLVLVLDDYHVIHAFDIHRALDFLLEHLPPPSRGGMHLVLLSRADPPMPLGRLRLQRELTEIRESDLRFTAQEVGVFLNERMALALAGQDVTTLEARTEGWIAGLQMAALALQDRPDRADQIAALTGSHRYLIDYLGPEVMARQTEGARTFLLRTSVLERFSASLCDAVLDDGRPATDSAPRAAVILEHLRRANLFLVPLDDEGQWFRYHHLFRDFLQRRLHGTQPALVPGLLLRASRWYEGQGMVDEAIEYALAAGDATRAARLLDGSAEAYVFDAQINKLIRLANRLPAEAWRRFPRLCIYYAWALQFEYRLEAAESALACAEAHLEATTPPATFTASQIAHHARAVRVYLAVQRDEPDLVIALARAALEALPGEAEEPRVVRGAVTLGMGIGYFQLGQTKAAYRALQSALPLNQRDGNRYAALSCIYYLMRIDRLQGALGQALASGRQGLLWVAQWSHTGGRRGPLARVAAHMRHTMAVVHYERNELDEAAQHLRPSVEYYELVGSRYQVRGYALLVDLQRARGEIASARASLDKLVQTVGAAGFSLPDIPVGAMIARCRLLLSNTDPRPDDLRAGAALWADTVDLAWGDTPTYKREYELLTLAQVRVAQGRAAEVLPLLARLVAGAGSAPDRTAARTGQLIAYLALQAMAHHACGQIDAAQDALSRALALGEPEGYVRAFVDHGAPMADLLRQARAQGERSPYVDRLLAAMPGETADDGRQTTTEGPSSVVSGPSSSGPSSSPGPSSPLVEPLNDREMQVLRLLAAGLSDRQIGEALYLSVNTIKWYNRQIYGKLGAGRRGQAVARAQELGLL